MEAMLVCEANARTSRQAASPCPIHAARSRSMLVSCSPAAATSPGEASPGWEQPPCPSPCSSALWATASVGHLPPPYMIFHKRNCRAQGHPFRQLLPLLPGLLNEGGGKMQFKVKTKRSPGLCPVKQRLWGTSELFPIIWGGGSRPKSAADLPPFYSAAAGKRCSVKSKCSAGSDHFSGILTGSF